MRGRKHGGRVAGLPGRLRADLGRVRDLHPPVLVDAEIDGVGEAGDEEHRRGREFDRGRAARVPTQEGAHELSVHRDQLTSMPRPLPCGMSSPEDWHWSSLAKIEPVPLIVMLSTTIAKHLWPWLDLLTAPLKVTVECGR